MSLIAKQPIIIEFPLEEKITGYKVVSSTPNSSGFYDVKINKSETLKKTFPVLFKTNLINSIELGSGFINEGYFYPYQKPIQPEILDSKSPEVKKENRKTNLKLIRNHAILIGGTSLLGFVIAKQFDTNMLTTIAISLAVTYAGVLYLETHYTH